MCGIFGMVHYGENLLVYYEIRQIRDTLKSLLQLSEQRGTDASGLCVVTANMAHIFKDKKKGSELKDVKELDKVLLEIASNQKLYSAFGHTRQKTKGTYLKNENNHPIIANKTIGVHNGIIFNDDILFTAYDDEIEREGKVDSEIIFRLIDMHISNGKSIVSAVKEASRELIGSYACAFINLDRPNYITLFKGLDYPHIHVYRLKTFDLLIFASESNIIDKAIDKNRFGKLNTEKFEVSGAQGVRINTTNGKMYCFDLEKNTQSAWAGNSSAQEMPCSNCQDNCIICPHLSPKF